MGLGCCWGPATLPPRRAARDTGATGGGRGRMRGLSAGEERQLPRGDGGLVPLWCWDTLKISLREGSVAWSCLLIVRGPVGHRWTPPGAPLAPRIWVTAPSPKIKLLK